MTNETTILTTKDFTILEVMRDRLEGGDDPLAPILERKIQSAVVMFREHVPADVATLSSRVSFSIDGRDPDTRILSHDRMVSPVGMFLPITTLRGLALLGLCEGQQFAMTDVDGSAVHIMLHQVHYQPEAAKREKEAITCPSSRVQTRPTLRLIVAADDSPRRLEPAKWKEPDDHGPSAA